MFSIGSVYIAAVISTAFIAVGAAIAISKIGEKAMDSIARQPETADKITSSMFLPMALIEGAAMFAMLICAISIMSK